MRIFAALAPAVICASQAFAQVQDQPQPDPREAYVRANLDADGAAIVSGLNRFTLDSHAQARSESGDVAISPASISTAFGLAYAGARGKRLTRLRPSCTTRMWPTFTSAFGALLRTMDLHQNGRTLTVNNAIWLQDGLKVRPEYVDSVHRNYGAGLQWIDYRRAPEAARAKINAWVESKTKGRIRNLLLKDNVTRQTRSVLVNTIYFKADWADPFNKEATKDEPFTLASENRVARPLMHRRLEVAYANRARSRPSHCLTGRRDGNGVPPP